MTLSILRNLGIVQDDSYGIIPRRAILCASTGKAIAVVMDINDSAAPVGFGERNNVTKIYVYESTNRVSWTLINTLTMTNVMEKGTTYDPFYSCAIGPDDAVHLVYRAAAGALRYVKLNATTYTQATDVQIVAKPTNEFFVSGSIAVRNTTEGATAIVVAAQYSDLTANDTGHYVWRRAPVAGTWTQEYKQVDDSTAGIYIGSGSDFAPGAEIACAILGGATNAATKYVTALSVTLSTGVDKGWKFFLRTTAPETGGGSLVTSSAFNNPATLAGGGVSKVRTIEVFPTSNNGFVIGGSQVRDGKVLAVQFVAKYSSTGTVLLAPQFAPGDWHGASWPGAINFSNGVLAVHHDSGSVMGRLFKDSVGSWGSEYYFSYPSANDALRDPNQPYQNSPYSSYDGPSSGQAHYSAARDTLATVVQDIFIIAGNQWTVETLEPSRAPAALTPAAASTATTSEPNVTANADLDKRYPKSRHKIVWQFATTSDFTGGSVRTLIQADSKFAAVAGTEVNGVTVSFSDILPSNLALTQGTWYVRAAHLDEYGQQGAWTAGHSFTVSHQPSATPVSPVSNVMVPYGTGNITFDWDFSDPYVNDSQTALQVIVEKVSDGSVVYDSTKIASTNTSHVAAIASGNKDIPLRWKVRVWDEDDVVGSYSSTQLFRTADGPSVAIGSPLSGTPYATPVVAATFTPTTSGGRSVTHYRVLAYKAGVLVHDSGLVAQGSPTASGVAITYNSGVSVYANATGYTLQVIVRDSDGMEASNSVSFSTAWTPPAAAAGLDVLATNYTVENAGYLNVVWNDTARDVSAFVKWIIYRRIDQINPTTGAVVETGTWEAVGEEFQTATSYSFRDYYAPSSQKVNYRVAQVITAFGDLIESETLTSDYVITAADGYWLMEPLATDETAGSFRLSNVVSDSYSDEYETAEYILAGRGRYVDQGDHLGLKGQLEAQLRDTNGSTARQKKRRLEVLREEHRDLYLRTPFGDVYRVALGNMSVGRLSGVGQSEFVDVSIPYMEIAE